MTQQLKQAFQAEMNLARQRYRAADYDAAFHHLERAHILGQPFYLRHLQSHFWMLNVGAKRRDPAEIIGQVLRMIASVGSLVGWVPRGNTGGANVNPFKPMALPEDIAKLFAESAKD